MLGISRTILDKTCDSVYPCVMLDASGKSFIISPLSVMIASGEFVDIYHWIKKLPSLSSSNKVFFFIIGCLIL
jgi:hypothetical protein